MIVSHIGRVWVQRTGGEGWEEKDGEEVGMWTLTEDGLGNACETSLVLCLRGVGRTLIISHCRHRKREMGEGKELNGRRKDWPKVGLPAGSRVL